MENCLGCPDFCRFFFVCVCVCVFLTRVVCSALAVAELAKAFPEELPVTVLDGGGRTALFVAGRNGRLAAMHALVEAGAPPDDRRSDGWTITHSIAGEGHAECLEFILGLTRDSQVNVSFDEKHVDSSGRAGEWTPLHRASGKGKVACVALLLKHGSRVDAQQYGGATALHWAAREGRYDVCELLLANGARTDLRRGEHGNLALHEAVFGHHVRTTELLFKHMWQTDDGRLLATAPNQKNYTVLHLAAHNGYADLCAALVSWGMPVNGSPGQLETPLHVSARNNHPQCVRMLLRAGGAAAAGSMDLEGRLPLDVATPECRRVFLAAEQGEISRQQEEVVLALDGGVEYRGEVNAERQPHGSGVLSRDGTVVYEGGWEAGKRNGFGRAVLAPKISIYCEWHQDVAVIEQRCLVAYADGSEYTGAFHAAATPPTAASLTPELLLSLQKDGYGHLWHRDRQYVGYFSAGKRHGWGVEHVLQGRGRRWSTYYGPWANDAREGASALLLRNDATVLVCGWQGGQPHGSAVFATAGGQVVTGRYEPSLQQVQPGSDVATSVLQTAVIEHSLPAAFAARLLDGREVQEYDTMCEGRQLGLSPWDSRNFECTEKWHLLFRQLGLQDLNPVNPAVYFNDMGRTRGREHFTVHLCEQPGPWQEAVTVLVDWLTTRYRGGGGSAGARGRESARALCSLAVDDIKSFVASFYPALTRYMSEENALSAHERTKFTEFLEIFLLDRVYTTVLKPLYRSMCRNLDVQLSVKLRKLQRTSLEDVVEAKYVRKMLRGDAHRGDAFDHRQFLIFHERLHARLKHVTFTPDALAQRRDERRDGDADAIVVHTVEALRATTSGFVDEIMAEKADDVKFCTTVIYPRTIALLLTLPLPTSPLLKKDVVTLANEVMMEELAEYLSDVADPSTLGADQLVPLFQYLIMHAPIDHMCAELAFVNDFCNVGTDPRLTRITAMPGTIIMMDPRVRDHNNIIIDPHQLVMDTKDGVDRSRMASADVRLLADVLFEIGHQAQGAQCGDEIVLPPPLLRMFLPTLWPLFRPILEHVSIGRGAPSDDAESFECRSDDAADDECAAGDECASGERLVFERVMRDDTYEMIAKKLYEHCEELGDAERERDDRFERLAVGL